MTLAAAARQAGMTLSAAAGEVTHDEFRVMRRELLKTQRLELANFLPMRVWLHTEGSSASSHV